MLILTLLAFPTVSATPADDVEPVLGCRPIYEPGELCVGNEHGCLGVYQQVGFTGGTCVGLHSGASTSNSAAPSAVAIANNCARIQDIEGCVGQDYNCTGVWLDTYAGTKCAGIYRDPNPPPILSEMASASVADCSRVIDVQGGRPASGMIAVSGGDDAYGCLVAISVGGRPEGLVCYNGYEITIACWPDEAMA